MARENVKRSASQQKCVLWSGSWKFTLFICFLFLLLLAGAFLSSRSFDSTFFTVPSFQIYPQKTLEIPKKPPRKYEYPLNCSGISGKATTRCPSSYYPLGFTHVENQDRPSHTSTCPEFFRWIHEDLRSWKESGVTKDDVVRAKRSANFRLVVLDGRVYMKKYRRAFQTRDTVTVWGILQLLRRYPGRLPDLDLMFDCQDRPVIKARDFSGPNSRAPPPPLFRYCSTNATVGIVFPDWSFWGWHELNIKPWERLLKELKEGNGRKSWREREPYAFWKGNPRVSINRMALLKCNVSQKHDWNARIYAQDWVQESQQGYNQSDLATQCLHRYKIYIEGTAWSVSQKYILACNSVTLQVNPRYYDFFTRSLIPLQHYWPVRDDDDDEGRCRSIKFAVDWGNAHNQMAENIGMRASNFIQEELKMDNVYDYMFHLLSEYGKLLKYKPTVPPKSIELCSEALACSSQGLERSFMVDSIVRGPSHGSSSGPCTLPPPYDASTLESLLHTKQNGLTQVDLWEREYWTKQEKKLS